MKLEEWEDRNTGQTRSKLAMIAHDVHKMRESKARQEQEHQERQGHYEQDAKPAAAGNNDDQVDDQIPF
jgi:single-stranded DNA-binding protein